MSMPPQPEYAETKVAPFSGALSVAARVGEPPTAILAATSDMSLAGVSSASLERRQRTSVSTSSAASDGDSCSN